MREREKEERVKMSGKNEMRKRVLYAHGVVFFTRVGTFFFFFFFAVRETFYSLLIVGKRRMR